MAFCNILVDQKLTKCYTVYILAKQDTVMINIQFITSGTNALGQRVVLWRLGNYRYSLEIDGQDHHFEAEYYDALDHFRLEVGEIQEIV